MGPVGVEVRRNAFDQAKGEKTTPFVDTETMKSTLQQLVEFVYNTEVRDTYLETKKLLELMIGEEVKISTES